MVTPKVVTPPKDTVNRIIFLCDRNTVRSPMASALFDAGSPQREVSVSETDLTRTSESYGIDADDMVDPFACAAMFEEGIDITGHQPRNAGPKTFRPGDLVIALSLPAFETAQKWRAKGQNHAGFELEFWSLPDVPSLNGSRDSILDGYRAIVRAIKAHMDNRFGKGV